MRSLFPIVMVAVLSPGVYASSFYMSPDVPTTLGATTYLPSQVIRDDSGVRTIEQSLQPGVAVDALHRRDDGGWLFSFTSPVQVGALTTKPSDVVRYDGSNWSLFFDGAAAGVPAWANLDAVFMEGGDQGNLVVSFDVPVVLGGITFLPADLVRLTGGIPGHLLDSTATTPPIPRSSNVTGADRRDGMIVLTFDVPTTLGPTTYLPGELVSWNGAAFASFQKDPSWPQGSRLNGVSFLSDPGEVPSLDVAISTTTPGALSISWTHSCSTGAQDYAIYEGRIGSWYSHQRIDCADDGSDFTEEIVPGSGDRYYLVVPTNPNDEGSYGTNWLGVQRPPGTSTCVPAQVVSPCP